MSNSKMRFVALFAFVVGCSTHASSLEQTPVQDGGYAEEDAESHADGSSPCNNCNDSGSEPNKTATSYDHVKNGDETDIDCGGLTAPKCRPNQRCLRNTDCESNACNYAGQCVTNRSCVVHFGGDTCGSHEVGELAAAHESCCKSLPVNGFTDPNYPGKTVYLDKYEITAGRVRAFVAAITAEIGKPDIKQWIALHRPVVWDFAWETYLPSDDEGGTITINRLLLGDPRHDGETDPGPGVIVPPPTDQTVRLGINYQFGGQVYADLHGNNCGVFAGSYGFPTYYYPPEILSRTQEIPRANALDAQGQVIPAQEFLDVKAMNCITNVMLAAFCVWDGGQLASATVMDYVTGANGSDPVSGCGTQYDNHGDLLGNYFGRTVQTGGRCADVINVNATFDAGDNLPVAGSSLNKHVYHFPDLSNSTSDKSWQIAAPGRLPIDAVRINPGDEPWMDLAGNLSESVLNTNTGKFGIRFRGIGYGSSRSDLNVTLMPGETILRVRRPEAKSALVGGRCQYYK